MKFKTIDVVTAAGLITVEIKNYLQINAVLLIQEATGFPYFKHFYISKPLSTELLDIFGKIDSNVFDTVDVGRALYDSLPEARKRFTNPTEMNQAAKSAAMVNTLPTKKIIENIDPFIIDQLIEPIANAIWYDEKSALENECGYLNSQYKKNMWGHNRIVFKDLLNFRLEVQKGKQFLSKEEAIEGTKEFRAKHGVYVKFVSKGEAIKQPFQKSLILS
jgi:hypothetical protein